MNGSWQTLSLESDWIAPENQSSKWGLLSAGSDIEGCMVRAEKNHKACYQLTGRKNCRLCTSVCVNYFSHVVKFLKRQQGGMEGRLVGLGLQF